MIKVTLHPHNKPDSNNVSIIKNENNNIKFKNVDGFCGFYTTNNTQFIDVTIESFIGNIYTVKRDNNEIITFNVDEYYFKTDHHSGGKRNRRKRNTNKSRKCKC